MPSYKISHQNELEWNDDDSPHCYVVILAEKEFESGHQLHLYSNTKLKSQITKMFSSVGHRVTREITQFETKVETGVVSFKPGMKVIGRKALRKFLDANSHKPLVCMNLEEVLQASYF